METRDYTIELTIGQKNALISASNMIASIHPSYSFLIEDLLTELDGFSVEDATFAADHCGANWDEEAILFAKEQIKFGESRNGLIEQMRFHKFNDKQIETAVAEVGY